MPFICWSIGLTPKLQPPGIVVFAAPKRQASTRKVIGCSYPAHKFKRRVGLTYLSAVYLYRGFINKPYSRTHMGKDSKDHVHIAYLRHVSIWHTPSTIRAAGSMATRRFAPLISTSREAVCRPLYIFFQTKAPFRFPRTGHYFVIIFPENPVLQPNKFSKTSNFKSLKLQCKIFLLYQKPSGKHQPLFIFSVFRMYYYKKLCMQHSSLIRNAAHFNIAKF
jgi:hypothetical protein